MYKRFFRKKNPNCPKSEIEWIEMDGREYYRFKRQPENRGRYFIDLDDVMLEAAKEEYVEWRKEKNHSNYLRKWSKGVTIISLYAIELEDGCNGEEVVPDITQDTEDNAIRNISIEYLRCALALLKPDDFWLLYELHLAEPRKTLRQISAECGIPVTTLEDRKKRIFNVMKMKYEKIPYKSQKSQQ